MPRQLPPGPEHIDLLSTLRWVLASPVPILRRYRAHHGDTIRLVGTAGPNTLTGDPAMIEAIYTADPDTFEPAGVHIVEPIFGRAGLTVTSGARHRRDRKLLTPSFHGGVMRAFGEVIVRATQEAALRLVPGHATPIMDTTQAIALDVIVRVVFGADDPARFHILRAAVVDMLEALNPAFIFFPILRRHFAGLGPWARWHRAASRVDSLLLEQITARRADPTARRDILSLLLGARYDDGSAMPDGELLDHLRTLLFAGHETTATALAWAMAHLHDNPDILARSLDEIDSLGDHPTPDALAALPFLEAVCQETMRLSPPVVDVARMTRRDFAMGPYTIPAGEAVTASPLLLHSRPDIYPEPARFHPTRFFERKFSPFEYIPFGGGTRRCMGAAFAMYEMKVVLGTLLGGWVFQRGSRGPVEHVRRGITMGPDNGVPMILRGRRARAKTARAA